MKQPPPLALSRLLVLLVAAGTLLALPATAAAQCSAPADTRAAIATAPSVFVGRVASVSTDGRVAQMQVLSIWKGRDLAPVVELRGAPESTSPPATTDRRFEVDEQYLVIPENGRTPFLATSCSATQRFTSSPNIIPPQFQEATGSSQGRGVSVDAPDTSEAQLTTSILPMLFAIALIGAFWVLILWLRSKTGSAEAVEAEDPTPKAPKPPKQRRRSLRRDSRRSSTGATRRVSRNRRRWRALRKRQERELASASKTASGSTDTS